MYPTVLLTFKDVGSIVTSECLIRVVRVVIIVFILVVTIVTVAAEKSCNLVERNLKSFTFTAKKHTQTTETLTGNIWTCHCLDSKCVFEPPVAFLSTNIQASMKENKPTEATTTRSDSPFCLVHNHFPFYAETKLNGSGSDILWPHINTSTRRSR